MLEKDLGIIPRVIRRVARLPSPSSLPPLPSQPPLPPHQPAPPLPGAIPPPPSAVKAVLPPRPAARCARRPRRRRRRLYQTMEQRAGAAAFAVRCAFIEIINEEARADTRTPRLPSSALSLSLTHILTPSGASRLSVACPPGPRPPPPGHPHQGHLHPRALRRRNHGAPPPLCPLARPAPHPSLTSPAPPTRLQVSGIRELPAATAADMQRLLETGAVSRSTGATRMNDASSRSHAIFTVMLQQRLLSPPAGAAAEQARSLAAHPLTRHRIQPTNRITPNPIKSNQIPQQYTSAKFHLVDLAGSERNKKTGASGERFREAININGGRAGRACFALRLPCVFFAPQACAWSCVRLTPSSPHSGLTLPHRSLLALGNVINALMARRPLRRPAPSLHKSGRAAALN